MTRGKSASAAWLLLAATTASGAVPKKSVRAGEPPASVKRIDCSSHRFETIIQLNGADGTLHDQTVRMCGIKGESDAEWITTLKDAIRKTAANAQMSAATKDQIIAAVNAEITRLSLGALNLPRGTDIANLRKPGTRSAADIPLARDYSALPPLPTASTVPPPNVLGPAVALAPVPHLTLSCALAGDEDRSSACDTLDKDTVLVVRADEAYPNGLSVRFMRHGNVRGDVDLPAMNAGETRTLRLPPAVCRGVVRSTLEITAVGANAPKEVVAGKVGEYDLRC